MELNKRGFFNPNPNGTSYDEALQMVGSGEAAMAILTSPSTKGILNFASHRDFIIWPTPATDDPQETRVPSSLGNSLGINAKSRNPEAALAFLKFMGSPEMLSLMGSELDLPVLGKDVKYDPIFADIMQMVNSGKIAMFMDNKWPNARVQQTHFSGIQELFAGSATIADVLKRMDQAYQSG
jgi:raffinose/stachyose/melibiose transport system substrate-binding protein